MKFANDNLFEERSAINIFMNDEYAQLSVFLRNVASSANILSFQLFRLSQETKFFIFNVSESPIPVDENITYFPVPPFQIFDSMDFTSSIEESFASKISDGLIPFSISDFLVFATKFASVTTMVSDFSFPNFPTIIS